MKLLQCEERSKFYSYSICFISIMTFQVLKESFSMAEKNIFSRESWTRICKSHIRLFCRKWISKEHIYIKQLLHEYLAFFQDKEYIIVPDGKIVQVPQATPLQVHRPN